MDPITLLILKAVASTCIKLYVSSLLGAGQVSYKSAELGYRIPKWYMNPGRVTRTFYAYGTSVSGDEFESIEDARHKAVDQMAEHIRLSNRTLIENELHYDASSVKQKRLIELFVRGEGLEDFIRQNAKIGKKQLVKVEVPRMDMRAFVRMDLSAATYIDYQETTLNTLKTQLMQQKTDDILDEMQSELEAWNADEAALPADVPQETEPPAAGAPPDMPDLPEPASLPARAPHATQGETGGAFGDMEDELDGSE